MEILQVDSPKTLKLFHHVPHTVYKQHKDYIYPLEIDVDFTFNERKNDAFNDGNAIRFVLLDNAQEPIGRIAAFYHNARNKKRPFPVGGIGFFECIEDKQAAFQLFDAAREWLTSEGMEAMDGPLNFGERDKFWGLLQTPAGPPTYLESYNPEYYTTYFKEYGFEEYVGQNTYQVSRSTFNAHRFSRVAEWISRKPGLRFRHFRKLKAKSFAEDLATVYNQCWEHNRGFQPLSTRKVMSIFKAMKHMLVEEFIWFAYKNDRPIAVLVMIPDVNQLLKHLDGKFGTFEKIKFKFYRQRTTITKAKGLAFGVVPDFQNHRIETVLIHKFYKEVLGKWPIDTVELAWSDTDKEGMKGLMNNMNATVVKKHAIYRMMFN